MTLKGPRDLFTEPLLERLIRNERLDPDWPSIGASDEDIGALHALVAKDLVTDAIAVDEVADNHGSGYASYKEYHAYPRDDPYDRSPDGELRRLHFAIRLSKLAPLADVAMGWEWRPEYDALDWPLTSAATWELRPHYKFLPFDVVAPPGTPSWRSVEREVHDVLSTHGFQVIPAGDLASPLWFPARIETLLGGPPYTVRDAIFHWMD